MSEFRVTILLISLSRRQVLSHSSSAEIHKPKDGKKRTGCFSSDAFEDVVDKRVKNGHCLVRDTGIRMHLLQH